MLRARQKLGKYLIERKVGEGGFAAVYRATDTVEGVKVALKIPFAHLVDEDSLEDFRKEVKLVAKLKHPNILALKNADFIEGHFVVAFPLGEKSLADRMQHRLSAALALNFFEQMLEAVAYAHANKIIHCDIKPENLLLFPDNELLLADFGIAKVALRTVKASGSGTIGHVAPEQAMGKPTFRSDVFSVGLIGYRMFGGHWPEWPFHWPPDGFDRIQKTLHADFIELLRRSIEVNQADRFRDGQQMLASFQRLKNHAIRKRNASLPARKKNVRDWRTVQFRQFNQQFGKALSATLQCRKCNGPVSEPMKCCPWCGDSRKTIVDETSFPQCCPRCNRGMKLDWEYCPWCYGPGFEVQTDRQYSDVRYSAKCTNSKCKRKSLMPFMCYCPWCRTKVRRKWKLPDSSAKCGSCGCGVAKDFWQVCPWCGKGI